MKEVFAVHVRNLAGMMIMNTKEGSSWE
jgi:hypothetical protein